MGDTMEQKILSLVSGFSISNADAPIVTPQERSLHVAAMRVCSFEPHSLADQIAGASHCLHSY